VVRVEKIDFRVATQSSTNDGLYNNAKKLLLWKFDSQCLATELGSKM
jgi:hypothetical protein